jgi:hypothetical protein
VIDYFDAFRKTKSKAGNHEGHEEHEGESSEKEINAGNTSEVG